MKPMMKKTTFALVMIITILMSYGGCGGDSEDENEIGLPGSGEQGSDCQNCPCDIYSIPQTLLCWGLNANKPVEFPATFTGHNFPPPNEFNAGASVCRLLAASQSAGITNVGLVYDCVFSDGSRCSSGCAIQAGIPIVENPIESACTGNIDIQIEQVVDDLSDEQVQFCKSCILQYSREVNAHVTLVVGDDLSCPDPKL